MHPDEEFGCASLQLTSYEKLPIRFPSVDQHARPLPLGLAATNVRTPVTGLRKGRLEDEELIPLSEAAALSGLTPEHLAWLARKGRLRAKKVGRDWLTTKGAVLEYLGNSFMRSQNPRKNLR